MLATRPKEPARWQSSTIRQASVDLLTMKCIKSFSSMYQLSICLSKVLALKERCWQTTSCLLERPAA